MFARVVRNALYISDIASSISDKRVNLFVIGQFKHGGLQIKVLDKIGGNGMKYDRNRGMYFGSWSGEAIAEKAVAHVGDSKGVTACKVAPETFGTAVKSLSGEYVFTFDGEVWKLNGVTANTETTYGMTLTGTPAKDDIIVVLYTAASGGWEALGKDNDDLNKELNPDTETSKNVLGESTFTHSGYNPEIGVDPYYIDPARKMYEHLLEIALEERYGEADCLGYFAEAFFTTANKATSKMSGYAYVRRAWFVPQSTGGDTSGYAIPVTINPVGAVTKKKIVYDMATNEATITDWEA